MLDDHRNDVMIHLAYSVCYNKVIGSTHIQREGQSQGKEYQKVEIMGSVLEYV